ncbi:MAG: N-6 DNA methylase [Planctomycetes bacterium]|nr:N-6 DNA methylase [Planctomycetota bacterium]
MDRWVAARRGVRDFVARRLSPKLARELLPITEPERHEPEERPAAIDAADFAALATGYPELLATDRRKRYGTWFTPTALAVPTAERALAPLLDPCRGAGDELRICDPAAGGGTFLLAALQILRAAGIPARRAALCLHGVDLDDTAAVLAALAIHEACGADAPDPLAIAANVHAGDGLLDLPSGSFDAVLTNPPWETLQATAGARERVAELRPRFRHQGGGKLYTYRLFVERAHQLLRDGGRFGLVVPASLWFDRDAAPLRRLLLQHCRWEWLFGFENRRRLFAIDSRYRFAVIVGRKGGRSATLRVAFGRTDPADWAVAAPRHLRCSARLLTALSPRHATFVECEDRRDLAILARMQRRGRPLTGEGGAFAWRQGDFNMTSDRASFVLRSDAEAEGFRRDGDGVWRRDGRELLPLYQGAMVFDLHPNTGAHRDGTGHKTTWQPPARPDELRPLYLVDATEWRRTAADRPSARIVLRALSNATNARTAVACLLPDVPCGNSLGVLTPCDPTARPLRAMAAGAAVLASLPFDWALRRRLTGTNLNGFVLADCHIPRLDPTTETALARLALRLAAVLPWHVPLWSEARREGWHAAAPAPAVDRAARGALLTEIDHRVGLAFGLGPHDVEHIAADRGPRGFTRLEPELDPAERRPARWRQAAGATAAPRNTCS